MVVPVGDTGKLHARLQYMQASWIGKSFQDWQFANKFTRGVGPTKSPKPPSTFSSYNCFECHRWATTRRQNGVWRFHPFVTDPDIRGAIFSQEMKGKIHQGWCCLIFHIWFAFAGRR